MGIEAMAASAHSPRLRAILMRITAGILRGCASLLRRGRAIVVNAYPISVAAAN
jgi:hypothetical protein